MLYYQPGADLEGGPGGPWPTQNFGIFFDPPKYQAGQMGSWPFFGLSRCFSREKTFLASSSLAYPGRPIPNRRRHRAARTIPPADRPLADLPPSRRRGLAPSPAARAPHARPAARASSAPARSATPLLQSTLPGYRSGPAALPAVRVSE